MNNGTQSIAIPLRDGAAFTLREKLNGSQAESVIRPARLSGENPANTTECTAPMRVQASMA